MALDEVSAAIAGDAVAGNYLITRRTKGVCENRKR